MQTIRTPEAKAKFLENLARTANVTKACEGANVSRAAMYEWRAEDEAFRLEWDAAFELGINAAEDELVRRGVEGVDVPIYYKGKVVGTRREYSDALLMAKLRARRPDTWKDRSAVDHTVSVDLAGDMEKARKRAKPKGEGS